jgi:hypothetical protein
MLTLVNNVYFVKKMSLGVWREFDPSLRAHVTEIWQ